MIEHKEATVAVESGAEGQVLVLRLPMVRENLAEEAAFRKAHTEAGQIKERIAGMFFALSQGCHAELHDLAVSAVASQDVEPAPPAPVPIVAPVPKRLAARPAGK